MHSVSVLANLDCEAKIQDRFTRAFATELDLTNIERIARLLLLFILSILFGF